MAKNEATITINIENVEALDVAIKKAKRLVRLLSEAKALSDSLGSSTRSKGYRKAISIDF